MADLIGTVRASESNRQVKIIVGGYPFNVAGELWCQMGADAFARDASEAVPLVNDLMVQESR